MEAWEVLLEDQDMDLLMVAAQLAQVDRLSYHHCHSKRPKPHHHLYHRSSSNL